MYRVSFFLSEWEKLGEQWLCIYDVDFQSACPILIYYLEYLCRMTFNWKTSGTKVARFSLNSFTVKLLQFKLFILTVSPSFLNIRQMRSLSLVEANSFLKCSCLEDSISSFNSRPLMRYCVSNSTEQRRRARFYSTSLSLQSFLISAVIHGAERLDILRVSYGAWRSKLCWSHLTKITKNATRIRENMIHNRTTW